MKSWWLISEVFDFKINVHFIQQNRNILCYCKTDEHTETFASSPDCNRTLCRHFEFSWPHQICLLWYGSTFFIMTSWMQSLFSLQRVWWLGAMVLGRGLWHKETVYKRDMLWSKRWLSQSLRWVPTGTKGYCTSHYSLWTVFSNLSTCYSGYTAKWDRKRRNFITLVMQEVQEPIKNHLMTPAKMTDFQMTHRIGAAKK